MSQHGVSPILVVIRGNSGSGKTSVGREVRRRYGRGCALLEQDYLRRTILREHDSSDIDPVAPAFITATARTALDLGYHVILEGILHAARYAVALRQLIDQHPGASHVYYLDVSFDETVRRHEDRREHVTFTAEDMRDGVPHDVLGAAHEIVVPETSTFEQTMATILHTSGLSHTDPLTPCPRRCKHCDADPMPLAKR